MALYLTEDDVSQVLDPRTAVEAVEEAFRHQASGTASNRSRQRITMPLSQFNVMAAGDRRLGIYGVKIYSVSRSRARFLILLYAADSGDLLSVIEADKLGQLRTGAASAVATQHMASPDADTVGMIGTGWQAEGQLLTLCSVRRVRSIVVYSRSAEHRATFAKKMTERLGIEVIPISAPERAVRGQSIIITATTAREPVLSGSWLGAGCHLNVVGSNSLVRREVDVDTIRRAAVIAVDSAEQARVEAGDLLAAIEQGCLGWEAVQELGTIVGGQRPGRTDGTQITLFKSLGIALEDITVAYRVYELAQAKGMGHNIALWSDVR
jgi:alanine dehydrogenase